MKELNLTDIVNDICETDIDEARVKKTVVRGGKRKKIWKTTTPGQKIVGGKAKRMSAAERMRRKRGARKAAIKRRGKKSVMRRKRAKSMKKRSSMGVH